MSPLLLQPEGEPHVLRAERQRETDKPQDLGDAVSKV